MRYVVMMLVAAGLAASLSSCGGGGGGGTPVDSGPGSADAMRPPANLALPLPSGHGLAAGEIRVAPGGSEEHGNVVVSCSAGGSACVVTVAADGSATYDRTGGVPAVTALRYSRDYSRDNPSAEDLLDHWNDPQTLRAAMGLSAVSQSEIGDRKNRLKTLLDQTGGSPDGAGVSFRNVRLEDIEIIGEKNGITYGQWKGGPAGTFNIELDWRFGQGIDGATRAQMERAGKLWARRITDDFGTHVAAKGTTIRFYGATEKLDEEVATNGLIIFVADKDPAIPDDFSTGELLQYTATSNDFEPWLGAITLDRRAYPFIRTMVHEIGHILGISLHQLPSVDRYVDRQNHTFEGPAAMRANGGEPVPFQWTKHIYDEERELTHAVPAAPGEPGALLDYTHLGVCTSVIAYCSGSAEPRVVAPGEIDFAFLADIGYETLDAATAADPEIYGWGAWGEYSAWSVGVERTLRLENVNPPVRVLDRLSARSDAFGIAPATGLADNSVLSGTATWSGSLLGADLGEPMLPPVFGDAELQVNLSSLAGVARFGGLTTYVENRPAPFRAPSLEYTIDVIGNSFSDADNRINGGFFGPAHEEMAGILDDRSPDVNLLAGFGGRR